jgi:hypothetical protein
VVGGLCGMQGKSADKREGRGQYGATGPVE